VIASHRKARLPFSSGVPARGARIIATETHGPAASRAKGDGDGENGRADPGQR